MTKKNTIGKPEKQCKNCRHFDNSKQVKDQRTKHAGTCTFWVEVTFLDSGCNKFCTNDFNQQLLQELATQKPNFNQLELF